MPWRVPPGLSRDGSRTNRGSAPCKQLELRAWSSHLRRLVDARSEAFDEAMRGLR